MDELLKLTRENNIMLKQIIQYINLKESSQYKNNDTMQEFIVNVVANGIRNNG